DQRVENFVLELRLVAHDDQVGISVEARRIDLHTQVAGERAARTILQLNAGFESEIVFDESGFPTRPSHGGHLALVEFTLERRRAFAGQILLRRQQWLQYARHDRFSVRLLYAR